MLCGNHFNNEIFSVSRPYSSLSDLTSLLQSLDSSRDSIGNNEVKHATMLHTATIDSMLQHAVATLICVNFISFPLTILSMVVPTTFDTVLIMYL